MNLLRFLIPLPVLLAAPLAFADDQKPLPPVPMPRLAPVASYANRADIVAKDGARAATILAENGIHSTVTASAAATLSVPAPQAGEARQLLARAVRKERLRLSILEMKGHRAVILNPKDVPAPKSKPRPAKRVRLTEEFKHLISPPDWVGRRDEE
jgi:hypothetical protein